MEQVRGEPRTGMGEEGGKQLEKQNPLVTIPLSLISGRGWKGQLLKVSKTGRKVWGGIMDLRAYSAMVMPRQSWGKNQP